MNAYYTNSNSIKKYSNNESDAIRRAYLSNIRKNEALSFIKSFSGEINSKAIYNLITILKVISGIICALGFFTVIGLMDAGSISIGGGIVSTVMIAILECLCFIPFGNKKDQNR